MVFDNIVQLIYQAPSPWMINKFHMNNKIQELYFEVSSPPATEVKFIHVRKMMGDSNW